MCNADRRKNFACGKQRREQDDKHKKGCLGKERNAEKSYGFFLNFRFFLLYRRFKLSFKIIVVVTNKMSHIKENVCIKLNIFYEYLAKLLAEVVTTGIKYFTPCLISANLPPASLKRNSQGFVFLIHKFIVRFYEF